MHWITVLLVASCCAHSFAAPQVPAEGENGVGNGIDMYSSSNRDDAYSEYTKLGDGHIESTPQGRGIVFDTTRKLTGDSSEEDSGESASTEDSDETSTSTKHSVESESASTEESDESSPPKSASEEKKTDEPKEEVLTTERASAPEIVSEEKKTDETTVGAEDLIQPKEETASTEQSTIKQASEAVEVTSAKPADEVTTSKPVEIAITSPKPKPSKPPKKKKPARATTVAPLAAEGVTPAPATTLTPVATNKPPTTDAPTRRYPCKCAGGLCSCCTGLILENFNVPIRSRACANVTYEPDDFAFNFKLSYNDRVLYNNRVSAKNPRPACIPINRYFGVKMCAKLSNVYMSGRNVHACLDLEGFWDDESAFQYSFNCFRIGTSGVALVSPEDGGGLPPPPDEEPQTNEDYDDSARGWTGDVQPATI